MKITLSAATWNAIFSLVGQVKSFPDDPVPVEKFSLDDIADVVAHASGNVGTWPWHGLFVLKDGRAAAVHGQCSRQGWAHTDGDLGSYAEAWVGSSVYDLWIGRTPRTRTWGIDAHVALYSQFSRWHALRCGRKLAGFLERDEREGWTYRRVLGGQGSSCSAAWVLDDELTAASDFMPEKQPVRVVWGGEKESCAFAMASSIVPIDYQGLDRVLCTEGHLVLLDEDLSLDRLSAWKCHCSASAAWYAPLNMIESPPGCFAKTSIGACGLVAKGVGRVAVPESKRAVASTSSTKKCDSCGSLFDREALTEAERRDDFWRCDGCKSRLFSMLDEMDGKPKDKMKLYEMGDSERWNWRRVK